MAATMVVAALAATGCKSHSPSHYVSPRVIGRVLDEQSRQPIAGVCVRRVVPNYNSGTLETVKGDEALQRRGPAVSDTNGRFALDSQKSVALFGDSAWFSIEVSFAHPAYTPVVTNYTPRMATNSPGSEPIIFAGDIFMTQKPK